MSPSPALRKFDGRQLAPAARRRDGQIAGRAGRHMNDGTFGTTDRCRRPGRGDRRGDREPPLRSAARSAMAQRGARFPLACRRCWRRSTRRRRMPRCSACASRTTSSPCRRWRSIRSSCRACTRRGRVQAAMGGLPGAGLPQDDDGRAHRPARPALPAPDPGRRAPAGRLDRQSRQATRTVRWRHRHVDDTHRACADLDLHFAPRRLDSARRAIGRSARARSRTGCPMCCISV